MNILRVYNLIFLFIITLFFFCNDIEDTISHHYEKSIFQDCDYFKTDYTRKYINGDPAQGRKKIWFIPIPAFIYDGWHLTKLIRQFIFFNLIFFAWYRRTYHFYKWRYFPINKYLIYLGGYIIFVYFTHWLFYDNLLLR